MTTESKMIETVPGWKRVASNPLWVYDLRPGSLVKFGPLGRNLAGKTGIFKRTLRKNICVEVDGKKWSVPADIVTDYAPPTSAAADTFAALVPASPKISTSHERFRSEVKVGDVILCWRGQFDVVKVNRIDAFKFSGTAIGGRSGGKSYKYQTEWYVQKLDGEKISFNQG